MGGWNMDSGRDEREWRQSMMMMMLARLASCATSRQSTLAHAGVQLPLNRQASPLFLVFKIVTLCFPDFMYILSKSRI